MRRLLCYAARGSVDLEQALMLLSRLERADFDARPYRRALDAFAAEVSKRLARERDALARPMVLVHYLGEELGFAGAREDYHHPDNVYLHRAIERKSGMPLTLAAIYMLVARRVGLRAAALPLPGHVLLRLYADDSAMIVDPFSGGRLCTQEECLSYLARQGLKPQPSWFHDASDDQLFQRQVMNLVQSLRLRGLDRGAHELYRLALVLDKVRRGGS